MSSPQPSLPLSNPANPPVQSSAPERKASVTLAISGWLVAKILVAMAPNQRNIVRQRTPTNTVGRGGREPRLVPSGDLAESRPCFSERRVLEGGRRPPASVSLMML